MLGALHAGLTTGSPVSGKTGRVSQVVDLTVTNPGSGTLVQGYTYQMKQKSR